ncbi:MAG: hypothetical protein QT08_C0010G0054 [archaeon GW2011_AR17]|nr:MAG: hypothetical protein QT08_C0010G0054 [archaeon GW2011_AR17]MBS3154340.1 histidine phosphatase family protein [Candidatus Woesearchaeota archaeon]HIH15278.1 histidine phosphatase family protein [Nanoarchaeota archaeon]HIH58567.1 histidine phosphatase family protein [Nanoarchaeota archaeon]HII13762.1 histidine phosphatase family protein [Nanoarchaeota archaeon]
MHYKIYLFRHGQTYYNKSGRFTGDINSHLTSQGKKDAQKIAQKLKKVKIDYAFETRLSRSKETLQFVLRYHPECQKILTDDRMIERDYGTLQGRFHKTVIKEYGQKQYDTWHRSYDIKPPRGESVKDVEKRVEAFIKDLLKFMNKHKGNVAISAHGNSMRPFRKYFEKLSKEKMMKLENPWDDYFVYTVEI